MRASASEVHGTASGGAAAPSFTTAAKGHPGPAAVSPPASPSKASARGLAIIDRKCSKGAGSCARPPTLTPRLRTICVSNGLVSIATRNPHSGHRKVTASEPSSGPSVEWSFIGASQSRHRNFIARHSITRSGIESGRDSLPRDSCASVTFWRRCSSVAEQLIRNHVAAARANARDRDEAGENSGEMRRRPSSAFPEFPRPLPLIPRRYSRHFSGRACDG